jgi:hypothetical protein
LRIRNPRITRFTCIVFWIIWKYWPRHLGSLDVILKQACTTYDPRAKCGPWMLLIWPVKHQIVFILHLPLIKTPFECVETYQLWPLDTYVKKKIWARNEIWVVHPCSKAYYKMKCIEMISGCKITLCLQMFMIDSFRPALRRVWRHLKQP